MPQSTDDNVLTGLKKRQQVIMANKAVFLWVAASSFVIVICIVAAQFLVRQALFNQKVINEKSATNKIAEDNVKNAKVVKEKVDALIADENLAKAKANPGDKNFQVILDALPADKDDVTFSNSLSRIIIRNSGATLLSLSVGDAIQTPTTPVTPVVVSEQPTTPQPLHFSLAANGNADQTKNLLLDLERTIRPITINRLTIQITAGGWGTSIDGETYYLPAVNMKPGTKSVKP